MNGRVFIEQLRNQLDCNTDVELAHKLSKPPARIAQLKQQEDLSPITITRIIKDIFEENGHTDNEQSQVQFSGADFVEKLKEQFDCNTDTALGTTLQVNNIANWKQRTEFSPKWMARIIKSAVDVNCEHVITEQFKNIDKEISNSIKTIIEYIPIRPLHQSGQKRVIIKTQDGYGHLKLRDQIEDKYGIYIFYNSSCCPVYVGKAKDTELWTESNSAYGRVYKGHVYGVNYKMGHQKQLNTYSLSKREVKMYELVSYYSSYEVHKGLIDKVEALLIRSFINDLSNVRVENLDNV